MRRKPEEEARSGIHAMFGLIIANLIVYVIQHWMRGADLTQGFALNVFYAKKLEIWRFFTAIFLHGDFMHMFFNMFGLYIFGSLVAPILGAKRFLLLYLLTGTVGNILWFLVNWNNPDQWLLGASGAVMGIIIASAMILPDIPMLLLFIPFPIKLKTLAVVYFALDLFGQFGTQGSRTAYLVHIFGAICGYLYMRFFAKELTAWDPLKALFTSKKTEPELPPGWKITQKTEKPSISRSEVERLLAKLSREGINALTEDEQEILRKAREEMMKRR